MKVRYIHHISLAFLIKIIYSGYIRPIFFYDLHLFSELTKNSISSQKKIFHIFHWISNMLHLLLLVLVASSASAKNVIQERQGKYCIVNLGSSLLMLGSMQFGIEIIFFSCVFMMQMKQMMTCHRLKTMQMKQTRMKQMSHMMPYQCLKTMNAHQIPCGRCVSR